MNTLTEKQRELVQEVLDETEASVLEAYKKLSQGLSEGLNSYKQ